MDHCNSNLLNHQSGDITSQVRLLQGFNFTVRHLHLAVVAGIENLKRKLDPFSRQPVHRWLQVWTCGNACQLGISLEPDGVLAEHSIKTLQDKNSGAALIGVAVQVLLRYADSLSEAEIGREIEKGRLTQFHTLVVAKSD